MTLNPSKPTHLSTDTADSPSTPAERAAYALLLAHYATGEVGLRTKAHAVAEARLEGMAVMLDRVGATATCTAVMLDLLVVLRAAGPRPPSRSVGNHVQHAHDMAATRALASHFDL